MNLKVKCLERYLDEVTGIAWKNLVNMTRVQKLDNRLGLDLKLD